MNKSQVDTYYKDNILPLVRAKERTRKVGNFTYNIKDKPARAEAYNNMIDSFHREGAISDKQAATYSIRKEWIND